VLAQDPKKYFQLPYHFSFLIRPGE